jgi:hypothetical protein
MERPGAQDPTQPPPAIELEAQHAFHAQWNPVEGVFCGSGWAAGSYTAGGLRLTDWRTQISVSLAGGPLGLQVAQLENWRPGSTQAPPSPPGPCTKPASPPPSHWAARDPPTAQAPPSQAGFVRVTVTSESAAPDRDRRPDGPSESCIRMIPTGVASFAYGGDRPSS